MGEQEMNERSFLLLLHDFMLDLGIDLTGDGVVHGADAVAAAAPKAAPAADA
jgi:hypothetical protein